LEVKKIILDVPNPDFDIAIQQALTLFEPILIQPVIHELCGQ